MGEVKHTPGPWFCDHEGRVYHRPDPLTKIVVADMQSSSEADESLIVSAPDLLTALKLARTCIEVPHIKRTGAHDNYIREQVSKIDAAIAKAESSHGA